MARAVRQGNWKAAFLEILALSLCGLGQIIFPALSCWARSHDAPLLSLRKTATLLPSSWMRRPMIMCLTSWPKQKRNCCTCWNPLKIKTRWNFSGELKKWRWVPINNLFFPVTISFDRLLDVIEILYHYIFPVPQVVRCSRGNTTGRSFLWMRTLEIWVCLSCLHYLQIHKWRLLRQTALPLILHMVSKRSDLFPLQGYIPSLPQLEIQFSAYPCLVCSGWPGSQLFLFTFCSEGCCIIHTLIIHILIHTSELWK